MSQHLQNFVKFQKFQLDNLVDFEKCCKTHIYLQKSVPIQPKTSNILPKFFQKWSPCVAATITACQTPGPWWTVASAGCQLRVRVFFRKCIFRKFCKFLAGSFSAVSKRILPRKYAFDSIFQALQDLHPFAPLQSQHFRKKLV